MSDFFMEDVKHHIAKNPVCRRMYVWDLLWLLFGIRKKDSDTDKEHKLCKAYGIFNPMARGWIMSVSKGGSGGKIDRR